MCSYSREAAPAAQYMGKSLREALSEVEREMVQTAYQTHRTSVKVAEVLGVSQPTAYRLIKKYCRD